VEYLATCISLLSNVPLYIMSLMVKKTVALKVTHDGEYGAFVVTCLLHVKEYGSVL